MQLAQLSSFPLCSYGEGTSDGYGIGYKYSMIRIVLQGFGKYASAFKGSIM